MPSLFSRSRTNSTPKTPKKPSLSPLDDANSPLDEFGRVSSRTSNRGVNISLAGKKDKDKRRDKEKLRARTFSSLANDRQQNCDPNDLLASVPDGTFLPLSLDRPRDDAGQERPKQHDYGYLSYERHVVLGLEEVARLVDVVADELSARGLTTPFIFSALALDISASAIKRLIQAFLRTCSSPSADAERLWREEARFASPHELGMCLRWGLARVVRVVGGQDHRGLITLDHYNEFRDSEAEQFQLTGILSSATTALGYPPAHFPAFLPALPPLLRTMILTLFSLLTRLTAHSASSGHTPPTLSPLFGPLLFGLGPATLAFHHTYHHYLRATNAMEHMLLAFIRWQDSPRPSFAGDINTDALHGSATALGVPTRLKDWIRGYPANLPFLQERNKHQRPQARRGARTVRVVSVRRNVRMYSPDLVKTSASWAQRPNFGTPSNGDNGLAGSKDWERIAPPTLKLSPRYSESYKKRMDMPQNFHPDTGAGSISSVPSTASSTSSGTSSTLLDDKDYLGGREGEDRFRSLTDLKWGEFEAMGFSGLGDEKKLQFDLTESARSERAAKRTTLSWNDFSASGFSRSDAPLNATLQFSTPVATTISSWPSQNAELAKKLKKTQRALPAFGWDTEPVMGNEEVIEEAFVDVFCDLVYGGGWMDIERGEEVDRECNWALVEFKSLPLSRTNTTTAASDPRTSNSLILFEEFVPLEYREKLAVTSSSRRRLPSLFSPSNKSKQWKQAATLNGRPYVVGHVPRSPSYREVEFEGLLHGSRSATKVISLDGSKGAQAPPISDPTTSGFPTLSPVMSSSDGTATPRQGISNPLYVPPKSESPKPEPPAKEERGESSKRLSRFKLPGGIPVPSPGGGRKSGMVPAEYSTVDFETRLASYSDDELNGSGSPKSKAERRQSRDDAWVDILVATHSRRMEGQHADGRRPGARGLKGGRSDPELASQEVAQALAGVRARSPLSDDDDNIMEAVSVSRLPDQGFEGDTEGETEQDDGVTDLDQEPDSESIVSYPQPQRRLGYFDLHPDRRPGSRLTTDDDPRARLDLDSDEEADDVVNSMQEIDDRPPSVPPKTRLPADDYFERKISPERVIDVPEFDDSEQRRMEMEMENACPKPESMVLPSPVTSSVDSSVSPSSLKPPSKTAALIELYRQKEQVSSNGSNPAPAQPSRLPVRTTSPAQSKASPPLPAAPAKVPSPLPSPPAPEPAFVEPPRVPLEETGRASPARYVHGAPLHNVLEEEEEEMQ